jgi:pimeloyl-ACP methyl ester carboxylesterase
MKTIIFSLLLIWVALAPLMAQPNQAHKVYLLPGQAADGRSFQFLELDPAYEIEVLEHLTPERGERMPSYARRIAADIDTTRPFSLVGVSLGGMTAVEMSKFLNPTQIILIASLKGQQEMAPRYKFLRAVPLYRIFSGSFYLWAVNIVRPWFEHDSDGVDDISRAMLKDMDPHYFKRAIHCIVTWKNEEVPENLLHIHGDQDNTLPYQYIGEAICLEGGTHMMVMTRAAEISEIINQTLAKRLSGG